MKRRAVHMFTEISVRPKPSIALCWKFKLCCSSTDQKHHAPFGCSFKAHERFLARLGTRFYPTHIPRRHTVYDKVGREALFQPFHDSGEENFINP